ncbi:MULTISPECIES: hypothetical protein [Rhizobium]|uniref:hypothetical protein n=1 Tax=Rhizobium TaxID=379 RepID=UPI0024337ED4|nr:MULTISPECIES: hypothetical protein [Rhizobium]
MSNTDLALTVSIGVVEIDRTGSLDQQLTAADQLLYVAKANGRNSVYPMAAIETERQKRDRGR